MPTAINEQIKILVELQKIDSEIYHLMKELESQPVLQKKAEEGFDRKKKALKTAEEELKVVQLKQKEREVDLQAKEEKVKKLQGQLYQLKTNKEYQAMEMEIKGLKADNSLLEEEILSLFDQVEEAKKKTAKEKELLESEEKKFKETIETFKKRASEITAAIAELEGKRKIYTPNIDARLLVQYEKILKGREGLALVPVQDESCGGCNIGLPPQVVNEIQIQEKIIVCESCARILYWAL